VSLSLAARLSADPGWLTLAARAASFVGAHRFETSCWFAIHRVQPLHPQALSAMAFARAREGRVLAALGWQKRVVRRSPMQAAAWFNLGYLQDQLNQPDQAVTSFARAVELSPTLDTAWYGLGCALRRLGHLTEALDALARNVALQPWSPHGFEEMVHVHAALNHPVEVKRLIDHLGRFEPRVAERLEVAYADLYVAGEPSHAS